MEEGYLVFTTHDGDEMDATFVPRTQEKIINKLEKVGQALSDDQLLRAWGKWQEANEEYLVRWSIQTRCEEPWPFNDFRIIGTFYLLVY